MTRLYTRRERLDFIANLLLPTCWALVALCVASLVYSWVTK